jgi:hypothetical protein
LKFRSVLQRAQKKIVLPTGAIDDNAQNTAAIHTKYVENAVDALLHGNQPKITKTKAIGCGISR